MNNFFTHLKSRYIYLLVLPFLFFACNKDDGDTTISQDLRILTSTINGVSLEDGDTGLGNENQVIVLTFSHALNTTVLEGALSFSGGSVTYGYDDSNSIVTLTLPALDFETGYTLSLSGGTYGADGESLLEDFSVGFTTAAFEPPTVTLAADANSADEGSSVVLTATLDAPTSLVVNVTLAFAGNATLDSDFSVDNAVISIPIGSTTSTSTITLIDDTDVEGEESIDITIGSLENGLQDSQSVSISILDNDVALGLSIKGVLALEWTTSGSNGGKAVHLKAEEDVADLSVYSLGVANNGGGTDGIEFTLPVMAASAGDDILIAREDATLAAYFGDCNGSFEIVIQSDAMNQNGDDAIELFSGETVIETYGNADVDGTGEAWEYAGSWGYKLGDEWIYGGIDCAATSTTTQDSNCTYPMCLNALQFQGMMSFEADPDGDMATDRERAIHLRANADIADLSVYGIGIANNGGGSDGREMDLPAISVNEGDHILFIRDDDVATIATYLGGCFDKFDHTAEDGGINFNGDDGVELYLNMDVIEIYGDVVLDGTGEVWEYTGSWAYKEVGNAWTYPGPNCAEFAATNEAAACSYSFCN